MRTPLLWIAVVLSVLILPAAGDAAFIIHLKNGGRIETPHCWEENHELRFYFGNGVAGIERNSVARIEKTDGNSEEGREVRKTAAAPTETGLKAEGASTARKSPEKVDLKAYQEKMAALKADLNRTLTRMKKAESAGDPAAREEAAAENRRISDQMYKLTDELKDKNNGQLPADWWQGIGKEEP